MATTIKPLDTSWLERAAAYQARLTMPTGALGRLLTLGQQLCAVQETLRPDAEPSAILVMAADHGIAAEGVSAYPQAVTAQMVANFLHGGAAVNVLARRAGASVLVVDMGVKGDIETGGATHADFIQHLNVARGTNNFLHGPAMSMEQARRALAAGQEVVAERLAPRGVRILALGEMGIGNTTSASALVAALTGAAPTDITGRGTGIDDAGWKRKVAVIEQALERHRTTLTDPIAVLAALGGFEIAGLAGAALEAARRRMVIVLDGLISSVAGLVAARIEPAVKDYFVAAHRGVEVGHAVVLSALGLEPLLELGLRLGEGSGAALALPLIQAAADIMRDMATFEAAGVSERD
jgi:nicotinate-nucleotide--dimethylbenzimidazole phosphoribosyltransferase